MFVAFIRGTFLNFSNIYTNKVPQAFQIVFLQRPPIFIPGFTDPDKAKSHNLIYGGSPRVSKG
jgi:hypothetical protein